MLIRVGFEVAFTALQPVPMLLVLRLHHTRAATIRQPEQLRVEPLVTVADYLDTFGNNCGRVVAPAGRIVFRNNAIVEDSGLPDLQVPNALQHTVQDLPDDTLLFLLASRYCEVDSELKDIAWPLFRQSRPGWARVQAVCDFVHGHIRFDYMQARANRTALVLQLWLCRLLPDRRVFLTRSCKRVWHILAVPMPPKGGWIGCGVSSCFTTNVIRRRWERGKLVRSCSTSARRGAAWTTCSTRGKH